MTQRRTAIRTCPLCEATCGLELTLEGDDVVRIRGDAEDVFSAGYICPKGAAFGELEADPDRLQAPLVRTGDGFRDASWDEAFAIIEERLPPLLDAHGRNAVAVYLGNPNVHNLSGGFYAKPLVKALGTRNIFTASTVDQMPKHVSSGLLFGDPLAIPVPDVDRTDLLVMLGANPWMSNGSLFTAPDLPGRMKALRDRGGRFVVIDPRRTRTAQQADEHLAVRPGTDALLLFGIVETLFEEGLADPGAVADHVTGIDEVAAAARHFPPETVAPHCGIDADTIRRLARELASTERAVVYGRIGTTTVRFGTVTSWLVDVVNVLTGHLDRPGGAMFPTPAHIPDRSGRPPFEIGRWTSRARGAPEVLGELPVAVLAEEIETPGDGQVRAFVTIAGNPVLSTPNSGRLDAALGSLDFMLSIDPYLNETTRHADVILPPPGALHRGHYDIAFYGLSVRNVANYSPPVLPLPDGRPDEWEILLRIAGIALGQGAGLALADADDFVARQLVDRTVSSPGSRIHGRDADEVLDALKPRRGPERLLDLLLRAGPYGDGFGTHPDGLSLARLEDNPHGIDLGALEPRLPDNVNTASGRVELAPPAVLGDVARLRSTLANDANDANDANGANGDGLVLVGRRHVRTNNSWMHNVPMLSKGSDLCTLQMHPDDARDRGLTDDALANITSRVGSVTVPVEITEDIARGVVSLPHGFGHDRDDTRMKTAKAQPGVNSNVLTDDADVDPLSGTAVLNGIDVTVSAAAEPTSPSARPQRGKPVPAE